MLKVTITHQNPFTYEVVGATYPCFKIAPFWDGLFEYKFSNDFVVVNLEGKGIKTLKNKQKINK